MNILVYGGWFGSGNLGDEAILQGVKRIFDNKIPDATLKALSIDQEYTFKSTGVRAERIESPRTLLGNGKEYLKIFSEADAHLLSGGTPFYDYGHFSRFIHMMLPALKRKKVYCFGVGSKPITTLMGREITQMLLRNTAHISTRDRISRNILQQLMGRDMKPIEVTGDSAMMLPPFKTKRRKDLILFCPRRLVENHKGLYHQEIDKTSINRIRHMQAIAADNLVKEGYRVSFVPFHTRPPDDDGEEIRIIHRLMKNSSEVLPRPGSVVEALGLLGEASLVVGLRLHSLILASIQGTPFTSIDYDIKIRGFMENMRSLNYLSQHNKGINKLVEKNRIALDNNREYTASIGENVDKIKERINADSDILISSLLRRNN
mgnify:CR=1 FL=1